jgi:hypothetical protein
MSLSAIPPWQQDRSHVITAEEFAGLLGVPKHTVRCVDSTKRSTKYELSGVVSDTWRSVVVSIH